MNDDDRQTVTLDKAKEMLDVQDGVHTFRQAGAGGPLVGADWDENMVHEKPMTRTLVSLLLVVVAACDVPPQSKPPACLFGDAATISAPATPSLDPSVFFGSECHHEEPCL